MASFDFVTLDVFTDLRFGGNPLVVFPKADGMDEAMMKALSREFNLSEAAFVFRPDDAANTARVRIFTSDIELGFAGHPNVGVAWILAEAGMDQNGLLRFEEGAGLVEVGVERRDGKVLACRVAAPQPLAIGTPPSRADLAACAGLDEADIGEPMLASVALSTACVPVSRDALARARCNLEAFRAVAASRPEFAEIFLLFLYAREGDRVDARMFAPLSGTNEDPATGSAACAMTGALLAEEGRDLLELEITQGVAMGRPSRMRCEARRMNGVIRTWVSGGCVRVLRGTAEV